MNSSQSLNCNGYLIDKFATKVAEKIVDIQNRGLTYFEILSKLKAGEDVPYNITNKDDIYTETVTLTDFEYSAKNGCSWSQLKPFKVEYKTGVRIVFRYCEYDDRPIPIGSDVTINPLDLEEFIDDVSFFYDKDEHIKACMNEFFNVCDNNMRNPLKKDLVSDISIKSKDIDITFHNTFPRSFAYGMRNTNVYPQVKLQFDYYLYI